MRHGAVRRHRRPVPQEGDAGDLRPGQPRAAASGVQPHRVRAPRLGRPGLRRHRPRLGEAARPHRVPRGDLEAAGRGVPVRPRRLQRRRRLRQPAPHHRGARPLAGHRRQPRVLPGHPPVVLRGRGRAAEGARPHRAARRRLAAGGDREAVRPRPAVGAGAQPGTGDGVPQRHDLPDRPLPRQGDRPEHPGDAVRQRDVRAALELQLRRPRADHDGRGRRHRGAGRLLRRDRRGARRDPEPPAPADGAGRDGGADVVRRACAADREAEAAGQRQPAPTARPHHGARPVRRRLVGRPEGARLPRGGRRPQDVDRPRRSPR